MTEKSTASATADVELATVSDTHLGISKIFGLSRRLIRVIVSFMTFTTVTTMIKMISAVWREAVAVRTTPFSFCMACGSTVACYAVIFYTTQFDGARTVVQIMLIVAVAVLTFEILLINVQFMCACIRWAGVTIGAI